MGRRGPAPKPTALKLLQGNPGRRPLNRQEPRPTAGGPTVRSDMSAAAQAVWARQVAEYEHTGVLTKVDGDAFRVYCEAVVRYETSAVMLERSGPLVKGLGGNLVRNPLHQIVRDNADLVRAYARELGFTPSARSALTEMKPPEDGDPLEKWAAQ